MFFCKNPKATYRTKKHDYSRFEVQKGFSYLGDIERPNFLPFFEMLNTFRFRMFLRYLLQDLEIQCSEFLHF